MNNGTVKEVKNNMSLMMSNLYYRMKLVADFIKGELVNPAISADDPY